MYDVVIVGAGPSGLTAATNTSHRGLETLVIEKQDVAGGLPVLLYPDKIVRDHPGFPVGVLGKELSRMLFIQAKNAGAQINLDEEVLEIEKMENGQLEVRTVQESYEAKRLILCTGIYNIPKKLDILKKYTGTHVHYKVENPREYRDKRLVIVGGGDHAFDTAVQLSNFTEKTTVLVRNRYAKAKQNTVELAIDNGVEVHYNAELSKINKDKSGEISQVQITNRGTNEKQTMDVDELFIAIGFEPVKDFLEKSQLNLSEDGSVKVDEDLQTNIKGVFAAGDVTGEIRLIATACAEGIEAAIHAFETIKRPYWLR